MNLNYPSKHCWPDLIDLRLVLSEFRNLNVPVGEIYQDFRASFEWLQIAIDVSFNVGKHGYQSLTDIKRTAERFIGREISDDAFRIAAYVVTGDRHLRDVSDHVDDLMVRVPLFDIKQIGVEWEEHVKDVMADVASNVGEQ